ncbi:hypothetical protein Dimus_030408, partial [Dionaea muscipula]
IAAVSVGDAQAGTMCSPFPGKDVVIAGDAYAATVYSPLLMENVVEVSIVLADLAVDDSVEVVADLVEEVAELDVAVLVEGSAKKVAPGGQRLSASVDGR